MNMKIYSLLAFLLVVFIWGLMGNPYRVSAAPLDDFVNAPDSSFKYSVWRTVKFSGLTVLLINMTSQTWLDEQIVSQPKWTHHMLISVPNILRVTDEALFLIQGGQMNDIPSLLDPLITQTSILTGSIVVGLYNIPTQPLRFSDDPLQKERQEDSLMAYGFKQFLDTGDPKWIVLFPMVKASVRAIDVAQVVTKSKFNINVERFTVVGASKRGWDAWLTAAADTGRVKTVIPVVIDLLNMEKVLKNIHNSLCGWPETLSDYVAMNITSSDEDSLRKLINLIDPLVFAERLTKMTKIIVNSANDDFFWPDGSSFSYLQLPGTAKRIRYVPNTGHDLSGSDAQLTIISIYFLLVNNIELPDYTFEKVDTSTGANLVVTLIKGKRPTKVLLWSCTNPNARDFRIGITGACYEPQDLTYQSTFEWTTAVDLPQSGYTSFFIEMTFEDYISFISLPSLKFTSSAYIIPETTPCT